MPIVEALYSGVDWYSATLVSTAPGYAEYRNKAIRCLEEITKLGYVIKPRGLLGYYGLSAGNCFVGERDGDSFVQFTGYHADRYFDKLYRSDMHVSRIDLQVTVKTVERHADVAKKAYAAASSDNDSLPASRRRKLSIIMGSDGGDTTYIGSPSSDQRGRIYNKEIQSERPEYTRCWRYEVVHRNEYATSSSGRIYAQGSDHTRICTVMVASWFGKRGIDVNWFFSGVLTPQPLIRTLPTDIEAKLRWIETQVKPTIHYLCELGYRDTLLLQLFPNGQASDFTEGLDGVLGEPKKPGT
jgi:hypothetical protein